jgi:hypothetical protein
MNQSEPPHLPMGARRAFHCLSLLLLPALVPSGTAAGGRLRPLLEAVADIQEAEPLPYLPYLGAPPLRFQDPLPPPDVTVRPAAAAPVHPHLTPAESSVGLANSAAASLGSEHRTTETHVDETNAAPPEPAKPAPVPILQDTVRPQVQAEDFLPFFLIPGSAKTVGSVPSAPQPGPLPPSSATYTETPK